MEIKFPVPTNLDVPNKEMRWYEYLIIYAMVALGVFILYEVTKPPADTPEQRAKNAENYERIKYLCEHYSDDDDEEEEEEDEEEE